MPEEVNITVNNQVPEVRITVYQGQSGLSAYDLWIAAGNSGTEADFLNSLKASAGRSPVFFNDVSDNYIDVDPSDLDLETVTLTAAGVASKLEVYSQGNQKTWSRPYGFRFNTTGALNRIEFIGDPIGDLLTLENEDILIIIFE